MSDPTNPFQNRNELKDHFEVERLRAELAAERERRVIWNETNAALRSERDALRVELAAAEARADGYKSALKDTEAELAAEREWQPMANAPTDGTLILAAVRVYAAGTKRFLYWDIQAVLLDEGLALTTSCGEDCGWRWEDFEVWKPIALDGIGAALGGENE